MIELRYPVNALVSYHYFAKHNIGEYAAGGLRLIGDSGAFSADSLGKSVDIDAFGEWGVRWRDSLCWVASLDVIGDADATWRNYRHLRERHRIEVVPTLHYGADPALMDRYAKDGVDFIGLGGMVGRKGQPKHLLRWCLAVFRYARDKHPAMRFHGWGVTHRLLVESLPWYSVDSSGIGSAYRYGRATLYDPDTRSKVTFSVDGRQSAKHATLLRKHYGTTAQQIATSSGANRADHVRLAVRSLQLTEDSLRRRFQVTPPAYGVADGSCGPHLHGVPCGNAGPKEVALMFGPHMHAVDAAAPHLAYLATKACVA